MNREYNPNLDDKDYTGCWIAANFETRRLELDHSLFPDLKWEDEPVEVSLFAKDFIQSFGGACYKRGLQDEGRFNYGENLLGNLNFEDYE